MNHQQWHEVTANRMKDGGRLEDGLHPDLEACLEEMESGIVVLRHPLVVTLLPISEVANAIYEQKREQVTKLESEGQWDKAIWLYERPFRMEQFLKWWDEGVISASLAPRMFRAVWIDSEDPQFFHEQVLDLLHQIGFVTDENHDSPQEPITVFRGTLPQWHRGMSWTRSMDIAVWFAKRFDRNGSVYECTAPPDAVLAMLDDRGEQEVILDPEPLTITQLEVNE